MANEEEQNELAETADNAYEGAPSQAVGAEPLGIERWVQFAFIALAAILFWVFDKVFLALVEIVGEFFDLPEVQPGIISVAAAVAGVLVALYYYKKHDTNRFTSEVVGELQHVTWPDREETWKQTVVVIITSIIASIVLFVFDQAWSHLTDLIYGA